MNDKFKVCERTLKNNVVRSKQTKAEENLEKEKIKQAYKKHVRFCRKMRCWCEL